MSLKDEKDREMIRETPPEALLELIAIHVRNIWRVDGLYFLGIEERFGTEAATEIDSACWKAMGVSEARKLREIIGVEEVDPESLLRLIRYTSWSLDLWGKEWETSDGSLIFRVTDCGTQSTRIRKGLGVFPCRVVREGYMEAFTRELDPEIEMTCRACPPGERPEGAWCEWEFKVPGR